jgi:hypothetical protein
LEDRRNVLAATDGGLYGLRGDEVRQCDRLRIELDDLTARMLKPTMAGPTIVLDPSSRVLPRSLTGCG